MASRGRWLCNACAMPDRRRRVMRRSKALHERADSEAAGFPARLAAVGHDHVAADAEQPPQSFDPARERLHHDLLPEAVAVRRSRPEGQRRSEEHTSELQSLMRISYAVFCLKKNN